MIESEIDAMVKEFDYNFQRQGFGLEQYLKFSNMDIKTFRDQFKETAEKQVKSSLVLEAITKEENVDVLEEEVNEEIDKLAELYNMKDNDEFKNMLKEQEFDGIKNQLSIRKTIEMLVENAKIA